ncbi:MAG: dihydropteroate synthase [Saprospiraceae bacterium]
MYSLNCQGKLLDLSEPKVMGILNFNPDSFFDGGRYNQLDAALAQTEKMLQEGAHIIDLGGASSRPGADWVSEDEERKRVIPILARLAEAFPDTIFSIDTWRSTIAAEALDNGASILNDISAWSLDPALPQVLEKGTRPYILMHMQGTPQSMQQAPEYTDVVQEVLDFFIEKVETLRARGVYDIVLDPGFGFGKTVAHNYQLLNHLHVFTQVLNLPVLAGISRKSMICKMLGVKPENALNGTTALHMIALQQGARILRVHDVKEAVEVCKLWEETEKNKAIPKFG